MSRIKWTLWGILIVVTAVWLGVDQSIFSAETFRQLRGGMVQYFGLIAIVVMSLCMILAIRPGWLENRLNGLDKMYRLHKWLGITALVVSTIHFLWAKGPKWLSQLGLIQMRKPGAGGGQRPPPPEGIEGFFRSMRGTAELVGEWAFYLAAILMILALVKRFNYRRFFQTHMILAATYLAFVFHGVILVRFAYWSTPVGVLVGVLMAYGAYAAVLILLGRMGRKAQVMGELVEMDYDQAAKTTTGIIKVPHWPGHQPGQFAFVLGDRKEGPHPYTIASHWDDRVKTIKFAVKALGDHTARLPKIRHIGQQLRIEGPYGRFTFDGQSPSQIWVGAGIGITPFMAKMEELAAKGGGDKAITLFHPVSELSAASHQFLTDLARRAKVDLKIWQSAEHGRLDAAKIMAQCPDWQQASFWFCGPTDFGEKLNKDLDKAGLPDSQFHQELFEMR